MGEPRRNGTLALAVLALVIAMGTAGASAWQREGDQVARVLMVAQSCLVVAGLHLLPALCRTRTAQLAWLVCLGLTVVDLVALYGEPMGLIRAVVTHLLAWVTWREALPPESVPVTLLAGEPKEPVTMKPEPGPTIH